MNKLITIQKELKAPKNLYNSFGNYKYRSCEDILEALKPILKKHDCTITIDDTIKEVLNIPYVESKVTFNDGKNIIEVKAQAGINPNRKKMDIAQSFGSSSSYARKYALSGLLLIDDSKEIDAERPIDKPKFTPKDKNWIKAVEALKSGNTTIEAIKAKVQLSSIHEKQLTNEASDLA